MKNIVMMLTLSYTVVSAMGERVINFQGEDETYQVLILRNLNSGQQIYYNMGYDTLINWADLQSQFTDDNANPELLEAGFQSTYDGTNGRRLTDILPENFFAPWNSDAVALITGNGTSGEWAVPPEGLANYSATDPTPTLGAYQQMQAIPMHATEIWELVAILIIAAVSIFMILRVVKMVRN